MTLRIIAAGGTLDKHYDEIAGSLGFASSHLPQMLARARVTVPHELEILPLMDSLDMQQADRTRVLDACRRAPETAIVITHGTDTMRETATVLGETQLAKTIVLTGSMIPFEMTESDAMFNFGFACAAAQTLPHGVYVAMNGQIFDWNKVQKNRKAGLFEFA
ncbi:MAG: asparaginase domain-containing protein [Burkholderiaceae bacterium]|nr:asparaginase domain-containing protein [Burkholderiaceae bacterium]